MTYLIDTQVLIWFQTLDSRLKPTTYKLLTDLQNEIWVSQVSLFEIAIKQKLNKLPEFDLPLGRVIEFTEKDGIGILRIANSHIAAYDNLPLLPNHRDPFDRLILATALAENLPVISSDRNFRLYVPQIQLIEA
ncbi:type II toxin-antitoxin system VapC family toxin [Runella sp.]|uniref:type II toxin-antitoxin system VapC family toxin n=1 Tax=Runella sp. TaxID=1960881 RepID=UPI0026057C03|nr:type II toxin-antitoxin system VapC family toxin [Runella sp.]